MPSKTPKPSAGEKLFAEILATMAEEDLEPDALETAHLERARVHADNIEQLEAEIARTGMFFTDSKDGARRPSPLLAEVRQQGILLARALSQISLTEAKAKDRQRSLAGRKSWVARSAAGNLRGVIPRDAS